MLAFLALDCQGDAGPVVWIRGLTGEGTGSQATRLKYLALSAHQGRGDEH
jgi:hypothetical protein